MDRPVGSGDEARGAIDRFADGEAARGHAIGARSAATGRERHGQVGEEGAQREREAGGARGLIRGAAEARDRGRDRSVAERFDRRAEVAELGGDPLGGPARRSRERLFGERLFARDGRVEGLRVVGLGSAAHDHDGDHALLARRERLGHGHRDREARDVDRLDLAQHGRAVRGPARG